MSMNLRDQLKDLLPEILPSNPDQAIKGTELIRMVKYRLRQDYSDATLRYHFSILCCDPSSPIAKVDQGQGYFLRANRFPMDGLSATQANLGLFPAVPVDADLEVQRLAKVRALFVRWAKGEARQPYVLQSLFSYPTAWKLPDLVLIDWELDEAAEQENVLNQSVMLLKQRLGVSPVSLCGVKLSTEVTHENVREIFFHALSTSLWAHNGELIIASPITDEQLGDELRRLGAEFGLGISSLGIPLEALDELEDAQAIDQLDDRTFENLQTRLIHRQKIMPVRTRSNLQWPLVNELRRDSLHFKQFLHWLDNCVMQGKILS
jgi:hypothetical protein